jgi:hypothetical protein
VETSPNNQQKHTNPAVVTAYLEAIKDFSGRVATASPGSHYQWQKLAQLKRSVDLLWEHMTFTGSDGFTDWKTPQPNKTKQQDSQELPDGD